MHIYSRPKLQTLPLRNPSMASSSSSFVFIALVLLFQALCITATPGGCFIKSIYSFGDSITDTGNLLRQGLGGSFTPIANFPYGQTIKKPTGRCSDGLLMIDYLALALDLPLVNPYLDTNASFDHGINFAVAGATALDGSFFMERGIPMPYTNSSLGVQRHWFKSHLNSTCHSRTDCERKLSRALFTIGEIGGNDYNYALFLGKPVDEVESFVPYVVRSIIDAATEVIDAGARQLVVPGNFPIGCLPSYLSVFAVNDTDAYDDRKCLKGLNSLAMLHNEQLQIALGELREAYSYVKIMYADYYHAFQHLLDNAILYGFEEESVMKACCGAGGEHNFDVTKMCGAPGTTTCENPANHVSWDGIHMTQEAYKIMAQSLMKVRGFTYPSYGTQVRWKC